MAIEDDLAAALAALADAKAALVAFADTTSDAVDAADLEACKIGKSEYSYPPIVQAINSMRMEVDIVRAAVVVARAAAAA